MTGGTLNRRNTISVGEDPSMVSGQSLTFDHDVWELLTLIGWRQSHEDYVYKSNILSTSNQ